MKSILLSPLVCGMLALAAGPAIPCAVAADSSPPAADAAYDRENPVVVELADGRVFAGDLGCQTDAEQFWLQAGSETIAILRPIDWAHVTHVSVVGVTFSGVELQRMITAIRRQTPAPRTATVRTITLEGR